MKKLLTICLLSFNSIVFAEQLQWYEGVVVLKNAQVLNGEVSVNALHDLVIFKSGEKVMVYPAHKIKAFYYYDTAANINRRFLSLIESNTLFKVYHLYEVVLWGDVSVLRMQKKHVSTEYENMDKYGYDYFIQMGDDLTPIIRFRKQVYPELLKGSHDKIMSFVHEKKLNPNLASSAIQIIKFYNSIASVKENALAAK